MRETKGKRYFLLAQEDRKAELTIYGDITSYPWLESDVSSFLLSRQLAELDVDVINVHINSYGGEVSEGLAIFNALKNHKATVRTYCDGFACSIASVIFMAGEERIMSNASMLMIHNAWTYTSGNAKELRKEADDLEKITKASINAYLTGVKISESELKEKMDDETWITPTEALEWGFASSIQKDESSVISQSVKKKLIQKLRENAAPKQELFTVEVTAGENGSAEPEGTIEVNNGEDLTIKAIPDDGYEVDEVLVDGNEWEGSVILIENIRENHTVSISFKRTEMQFVDFLCM